MLSKYLNCFLLSGLFLCCFTSLTAQTCTSNLVNNPGFEQGTSGWNVVFGNANTSSDANSGSSAIELGGALGDHVINQAYAGKPNTDYTVRAFMKKNNTNLSSAYAQIRFFNASWQQLPVLPAVFNGDNYTEVVATRTSPANTAYVGIEFSYRPRNASDIVVIDDVCFVEGTSVPSGGCSISATVTNESCDDNGTSALFDDISSATFMVNNGGAAGSYTASYRVGTVDYTATGTYGNPLTITNIQSISFGNSVIPVEVRDNANPNCLTTTSFRVSEACSTPNPGACDLTISITNSACFDNGTPNNAADDYYNATVTINNPTGSIEGADVSYVLGNRAVNFISHYGTTININRINIAQDGSLSIFIADHDDPNCFETRTTTAPQSCSTGGPTGSGADLELTATSTATSIPAWSNATVKFTLTNNGTSTASNINVGLNIGADATPRGGNEFTASQGTLASFWTRTPTWQVGSLAPGQSATIDLNLFTLSANEIPVYGQVSSVTGSDPDSTPGNGACCTANEDDEAVFVINGSTTPPVGGGNANIFGLTAAPFNPAANAQFTSRLTLKNVSFSLLANDVRVRFQLPAGVSFQSNPFSTAKGSYANGVWNVGTLAGDESAFINFNLVRNTSAAFTITAEVISGSTGGRTTESINIPATTTTPPTGGGNANIFGLTAAPFNPAQWGFFTSTVTVKNVSFSQAANDVRVKFELPNGVTFKGGDEFSTSKGSFSIYGDNVWNIGTLAGDESATITFNLFRITANSFSLTAEVTSGATGGNTTETITIGAAAAGVNNRSAVIGNMQNESFAITNAYPNPTTGSFKIDVYSNEEKTSELTIIDILGKPVYQQEVNLVKGINTVSVNLEKAAPGFLTIQMTPTNKYLRQIRVMKITE